MDLDLLDRLIEHDAWTTRRVLDLAAPLTDAELDRDFDIGHRTVRGTVVHVVRNIETWTDLMAGRAVRRGPEARTPIAELRRRFDDAFEDFARIGRQCRDAGALGDRYLDTLDRPPRSKSYAGTILHVLTHDHQHRAEILHMLQRLGVSDLIEGDVLSWETARGRL